MQFVPADALEAQQMSATDPMMQSFSGLMRCLAAGDQIDMKRDSKTFPLKLTPVKDYVAQMSTAT